MGTPVRLALFRRKLSKILNLAKNRISLKVSGGDIEVHIQTAGTQTNQIISYVEKIRFLAQIYLVSYTGEVIIFTTKLTT